MAVVITSVFAALCIGILLAAVRLVRGPATLDRVIALEVILVLIASGVALEIARSGRSVHVALLIAVTLGAFIGSLAAVRLLENRERHR